MNEVVKVSISGIGFVFDTDAYQGMKAYLDRLETAYGEYPDGREIINDIEARIVEIILSKQSVEQVVARSLVDRVIEQMGRPDQIGEESGQAPRTDPPAGGMFPRRLYRNPEGARLGGVCNGLATFLGIDTVWVRLAVFVPLLLLIVLPPLGFGFFSGFLGALFGMLVLLYFVLWFAVPLARTPRQKLEMRGERITVSSIRQGFEQDAVVLPAESRRSTSALTELVVVLGRILVFGVKAVAILVGFILAITAVGLVAGLVMLPFRPEMVCDGRWTTLLSGMEGVTPEIFTGLLLFIVLVPLLMVVYLIGSLLFHARINRVLMGVLGGAWLLVTAYTATLTFRNFELIRSHAERYESDGRFPGGEAPSGQAGEQAPGRGAVIAGDSIVIRIESDTVNRD